MKLTIIFLLFLMIFAITIFIDESKGEVLQFRPPDDEIYDYEWENRVLAVPADYSFGDDYYNCTIYVIANWNIYKTGSTDYSHFDYCNIISNDTVSSITFQDEARLNYTTVDVNYCTLTSSESHFINNSVINTAVDARWYGGPAAEIYYSNTSFSRIIWYPQTGYKFADYFLYNVVIGEMPFDTNDRIDIEYVRWWYGGNVSLNTNVDSIHFFNNSYNIEYNISSGFNKNMLFSHAEWYQHTFGSEIALPLTYNLTFYIGGLEVYNLVNISFQNYMYLWAPETIKLNIHTFNSLGNYENAVDIMIKNNDTGNGYYIRVNSQDNLTVLSGELMFLCAGNSDTLEKRSFSVEILANTTVYIYLNLTSTMDYDKDLIDYEVNQKREMFEGVAARTFIGLVIACLVVYALYRGIGR